jgi:hypothetical protein
MEMSANPNVPVLFYSERCPNSKEVVQTIQALNKASLFRFVCIDTTPRHYIPPEIKSVPTVINPQTKEVIVGKAAIFARISKPVDSRREVPQGRAAPPVTAGDPMEWSFNDVRSLSSGYSVFDTETKESDDQLRYTYVQGLVTSGQDAILPDGSIKSQDTSKSIEAMQALRDAEFRATARS